jgi:hypothetical protein
MSEAIKPDLVLNMKREWLAKVWNGEKTVEYRERKPYWDKRIGDWVGENVGKFVLMVWGYRRDTPAVLLQVDKVDIGICPYKGWDGEYYRLHFAVVGHYMKYGDMFAPMDGSVRMKEEKEQK